MASDDQQPAALLHSRHGRAAHLLVADSLPSCVLCCQQAFTCSERRPADAPKVVEIWY
jgi:hypothetical protein